MGQTDLLHSISAIIVIAAVLTPLLLPERIVWDSLFSMLLTGCANENIALCLNAVKMQQREKRCLHDCPPGGAEKRKHYRLSVSGHSALIIRHPALDVSENGHLSPTHTVGNLCCSAATSWLVQIPASVTAAPALHSWRWGSFFSKGLSQWANTPTTRLSHQGNVLPFAVYKVQLLGCDQESFSLPINLSTPFFDQFD